MLSFKNTKSMKKRCQWPSEIEKIYVEDKKWNYLFQAGLSWKIVLQKKRRFKKGFLRENKWLKCQIANSFRA